MALSGGMHSRGRATNKKRGLLIVDNTDRHWFRKNPIAGIPSDWKFEVFQGYAPMIGHRSETMLYRRPD